jgi:membrane protein YqaA with SNARE-associated domain
MTVPFLATLYGRLTTVWTDMAIRWGYAGAFVAALIGSTSATVFFPYTIIVFFLATQGLNPFWLGLLMGLGAGIGQMVGYIIGTMGTTWFQKKKPETTTRFERILAYRPRVIIVLLIIFALRCRMICCSFRSACYGIRGGKPLPTLEKLCWDAGDLFKFFRFTITRPGTAAGATGIVSQLEQLLHSRH